MEFVRIPYFDNSAARDFDKEIKAPLEDAYTDNSSKPFWPTIEAKLTIDPGILFLIQK